MRSMPCQITKEISAQDLQELFNAEVVRLRKEYMETESWQPLPSMVMAAAENVMDSVIHDILRNYPHGTRLCVVYTKTYSTLVEVVAEVMARKPYEFSAKLEEEG